MAAPDSSIGRTLWKLYLLPGYLIGGIKLLCVSTWFLYQPVAAMLGQSEEPFSLVEYAQTAVVGLVGAALVVVGWPIALYMALTGFIPIGELLFFPWAQYR